MPFVCIFTVVKVILESPPAPRDAQTPPGASQGLPEHQNKYFACIFTIHSMLRQASCMHFYDIFYVAAGILYAFLRYILYCGRHLVCIFMIYSMLRQVLCMHFYDIFYVAVGVFYAYLRYICDKRARHILSMHIYDILCDNPFFAISMIRCIKMTPPLCCGRRLHAFLR